ncbi:MAG: acyl-CoA dehydrogenase family protein [Alphaproteobacteria bacterium]|nr:acyl-CoA dehydrogenase family protein [Alphaproteobacteria bacterium]
MSDVSALLEESVARALAAHADRKADAAMRAGSLPEPLRTEIAGLGIGHALLPEDAGGAGCGWRDIMPVLRALGRAAAPLPVAEEMVARRLVERAGLPQPDGLVTLAPDAGAMVVAADGSLSGTLAGVPWGRFASAFVIETNGPGGREIVLLPAAAIACEHDANLAGEPRDLLSFRGVQAIGRGPARGPTLRGVGAAMRAGLIAGAVQGAQHRAVAYAGERQQFGKPLAAFQAIQQQLAVLAEESLAADMAARGAFAALEGPDAEVWCAIARLRADDAASGAIAIAHQVHGAIGFTREHDLHRLTTRLMSWRAEFGSTGEWSAWLAGQVGGDARLWDRVVTWSAAVSTP